MKKRISVDPKDVKPGDWVRLRGYGYNKTSKRAASLCGVRLFNVVSTFMENDITIEDLSGSLIEFDRINIISAEREVDEEPKVEVGTWQFHNGNGNWVRCSCNDLPDNEVDRIKPYKPHRVLRSTGWSPDTRKNTGPIKLAVGMIAKATGYAYFDGTPQKLIESKGIVGECIGNGFWCFTLPLSSTCIHERNLDICDRRKA